MAVSSSQVAFAEELFAGLGARARRMFGGAGLYAEGVMFGMITDGETICLKADGPLSADLAAEGAVAWVYTYPSGPKAGQTIEMGYWTLPDAAMDDPADACDWARRALHVALKAQAAKPAKRRKR
jgi:DNA transformation protein